MLRFPLLLASTVSMIWTPIPHFFFVFSNSNLLASIIKNKLTVGITFKFLLPATIFAYGQTSSGKTYTMNRITQYAVADIYSYIEKVSKFYICCQFLDMDNNLRYLSLLAFFRLSSFPVYSPSFVNSSFFSYIAWRKSICFEVFCTGNL